MPKPEEILKLNDTGQVLFLADQLSRYFLALARRFVSPGYLNELVTPWSKLVIYKKDHLEWLPTPGLSIKTIITTTHQIHDALYQLVCLYLPRQESVKNLEQALIAIYKKHTRLTKVYTLLLMMPAGVAEKYKLEWMNQLLIDIDKKDRDMAEMRGRIQLQAGDLGETFDELRAARDRMTVLSQARQDFIGVVSHQFRTPLSAIRWNAELLQESLADRSLSPEELNSLGTIAERSKYLIETLNKVFDALGIDTGEIKIDRKPGFVWELAAAVIDEYKKDAASKKMSVNFDKSADPLRETPLDQEKIRNVIRILVSNAINYSDPGKQIDIKTSKRSVDSAEFTLLTVADQGIGISEEEKERVFEKFFRGQEAIKRVPDGTGLGLYIVKNFIEAHGGQVWFESTKGKGTTFYLTIPIKK